MTTSRDSLDAFMGGLGYELEVAEKDHRQVTRYKHKDGTLQNISKDLANHLHQWALDIIGGLSIYDGRYDLLDSRQLKILRNYHQKALRDIKSKLIDGEGLNGTP